MSTIDPNKWRKNAGIPVDDTQEPLTVTTGMEEYNSQEGQALIDASRAVPEFSDSDSDQSLNVRNGVPEVSPESYTGPQHEASTVSFLHPKNLRSEGSARVIAVVMWSLILGTVLAAVTDVPWQFLFAAVPASLVVVHGGISMKVRGIVLSASLVLFVLFALIY